MQWEKTTAQKDKPRFEFKEVPNALPFISEGREGDPMLEMGPMVMTYDPSEG